MSKGFSLHIGLNGVDASKYSGWPGTLSGCVNDANAMQAICSAQGFKSQMLLNGDAVADAILGAIGQSAFNLQSEDTFILSFSGHGGQVPDTTGASPNGLDDTWAAYDRMILGHELYNLWGQFASDVRIEVYSDSCHSGTVIRDLFTPSGAVNWPNSKKTIPPLFASNLGMENFRNVYTPAAKTASKSVSSEGGRAIPQAIALGIFDRDREMYEAAQWSRKRAEITASVILISGCQDNQEAQDGQNNGLFTEKLLDVWGNGQFAGNLPQFHQAIVALMPSSQTPDYFAVGVQDDIFTNSRPMAIVATGIAPTPGSGSALLEAERATNTVSLDGQIRDFFTWAQSYPAGRTITSYVSARQSGILPLLQSSPPFRDAIGELLRVVADLSPELVSGADVVVPDQAWPAIELVAQTLKAMRQDPL